MIAVIKRTPADIAFSNVVREANDYICYKCKRSFRHNPGIMDNSHFYGRRNSSTRLEKLNCFCLCRGCHNYFGEHPHEHSEFVRETLGETLYDILIEKARQIVKLPKSEIKKAAKHYREQLKIIEQKRLDGQTGHIDFISW